MSSVRFLDNFSAGKVLLYDDFLLPLAEHVLMIGTRGATSAEYFLSHDYAVIFMHRHFSLQPFSRHYSHSTNPFLDFLEFENGSDQTPPRIMVDPSRAVQLAEVLSTYKQVQAKGTLHTLTFVTINEYLYLLRAISHELNRVKRKALYYLAAAVSDFFLPTQKMVCLILSNGKFNGLLIHFCVTQSEHKIQSRKGSLQIEMDQVPKILQPMVDEWTPEAFIVSFKVRVISQRFDSLTALPHLSTLPYPPSSFVPVLICKKT